MFLFVLITVILWGCGPKPPVKSTAPVKASIEVRTAKPAPVTLSGMEVSILQEVNRHRATRGLKPLLSNPILDTEAALHSQQMASRQVPFGHDGYSQRMARIEKRMGGAGATAENVAYGKMGAREVVAVWLKSAGHKKNIEGPYHSSGIGISRNSDGVFYFTQIFTQQ